MKDNLFRFEDLTENWRSKQNISMCDRRSDYRHAQAFTHSETDRDSLSGQREALPLSSLVRLVIDLLTNAR